MFRKQSVLLAIAISTTIMTGRVEAQVATDSLLSDFDIYVEYLTDTHPDPFTAFGGRAFFYNKVYDVRKSLASNPELSKAILADSLADIAATLGDGHTVIYRDNNTDNNGLFAVGHINQTQDSLFLVSSHRDNSKLLGARISKIGGVDADKALRKAITKTSSENRFGPLGGCVVSVKPLSEWKKMFGGISDNVNLELITPAGDTCEYIMPLLPASELNAFAYARLPENYDFPKGLFQYKLIDSDNKIMMISVPTIAGRENFEYCYNTGKDFAGWMRGLYGYLGKQMPADTLEAIKGFPAFFDKFRNMLTEMKKDRVPYLIIDLRGNSGGWTPIVKPTLLLLFGDRYVKSTRNESELYIKKVSPLYLKNQNQSIEEYNKSHGINLKINDFEISKGESFPDDSVAYYRNGMIEGFLLPESEKLFLKNLKGEPLYEPERVFVVTDAGTFSAAFHYSFFLNRDGAEIVGVASSQAPNTFMETTAFTLPYSGIKGSISNSQQIFLPPSNPRSKEFTPDIPMNYSTYKHYDFHLDTPIYYLMDLLKSK